MPEHEPDRSETGSTGPRHAAEPARRRRATSGRTPRLGRVRHRRGDAGSADPSTDADRQVTEPKPGPDPSPEPEVDTAVEVESVAEVESAVEGTSPDAGPDRVRGRTVLPVDETETTGPTESIEAAGDGRSRLTAALGRPGRGQVLVAILLLLFGLAVVTQVRLVTQDSTYANARREDLIQLLDGLTQENRRLEGEQADLDRTKTNLESGANAQQVAREEAEKRIEVLSILAGTVPAEGQGIRMVITDPQGKVTAEILLDAVEEMRDAGAEVIEINDSIRLVASSSFGVAPNGQLQVDGKLVTRPLVIEVIGDPHSLAEGANFRGGIVSEITSSKVGGTVVITQLENVSIDSLHTPKTNQYARPSSPEPTR